MKSQSGVKQWCKAHVRRSDTVNIVQSDEGRCLPQRCRALEDRCIRSAGVCVGRPALIYGTAGAVRSRRAAGSVCRGVSVQTDWFRTIRVSVCRWTCVPADMQTRSIPPGAPCTRTATAGRTSFTLVGGDVWCSARAGLDSRRVTRGWLVQIPEITET